MDTVIFLGYALFLLVGAFFGWKAGSKISLIMGLASSALVFLGYLLAKAYPKPGLLFLTLIGAGLSVVFISRFLKTGKVMPSGMLCFISAAFGVYCLTRLLTG